MGEILEAKGLHQAVAHAVLMTDIWIFSRRPAPGHFDESIPLCDHHSQPSIKLPLASWIGDDGTFKPWNVWRTSGSRNASCVHIYVMETRKEPGYLGESIYWCSSRAVLTSIHDLAFTLTYVGAWTKQGLPETAQVLDPWMNLPCKWCMWSSVYQLISDVDSCNQMVGRRDLNIPT